MKAGIDSDNRVIITQAMAEMDKTDTSIRRGIGPGASEDGVYAADGGIKYNPNQ